MSSSFSTFVKVWSQVLLDTEKHAPWTQDDQLAELCDIMEDLVMKKDVLLFDSTKKMERSDVNKMDFHLLEADIETLVKESERIPNATGSLVHVLRTLSDSCFSVRQSSVGKSNATAIPFAKMGAKLGLMMTLVFWAASKVGKLEWVLDNCRLSLSFLIQLAHNLFFCKQGELRSSLEESFASSTIGQKSESITECDKNYGEVDKKKRSKECENIFVATLTSISHIFFSWAPNVLFTVGQFAERARKYVLRLQRLSRTKCALPSSLSLSEHLDVLKEVAKELDFQWISIQHSLDVCLFPPPLKRLEKSPSPIDTNIDNLRGISLHYSVSPSPSAFIPLTPTTLSRGERTESRSTDEDEMMTSDSKKVRISYSSKSSDKPASEEPHSCTPFFFAPSEHSDELVKSVEEGLICSSSLQHQSFDCSIEKYENNRSEGLNSLKVAPSVSVGVPFANRVQEKVPLFFSHSSPSALRESFHPTMTPKVVPKSSLSRGPSLLCPFPRISHVSPLKSVKNNAETHEIQSSFCRVPLFPRNVKSASTVLACGEKNKTVALSTPMKPLRRCSSVRFAKKTSELSINKCEKATLWKNNNSISGFPVHQGENFPPDAKNLTCKLSTQMSSSYFPTTPPRYTPSRTVLPPLFSFTTNGRKAFSTFEKDAIKSSPVRLKGEHIVPTSGSVGRIQKIGHHHCMQKEADP